MSRFSDRLADLVLDRPRWVDWVCLTLMVLALAAVLGHAAWKDTGGRVVMTALYVLGALVAFALVVVVSAIPSLPRRK